MIFFSPCPHRTEIDLGLAPGNFDHLPGDIEDGGRLSGSDLDDLANRGFRGSQHQRLHDIAHENEIRRLQTVAIYGQWSVVEGVFDKGGHHLPPLPLLVGFGFENRPFARTVTVRDIEADRGQAIDVMEHLHELGSRRFS